MCEELVVSVELMSVGKEWAMEERQCGRAGLETASLKCRAVCRKRFQ